MIVDGKSDVFIFEACLLSLGDPTLGTSEVFVVRVTKKGSLREGLECGYLSHATIVESLEPAAWVVLTYASREGREGCGMKPVLAISLM